MSEILQTFGVDWKLLIVQAVNFGALLVVLTYFLYKPTLNLLEERRQKVEKGIQDANDAKEQLRLSKEEGDKTLRSAAQEANEIVEKTRKNAALKKEEILHEAEEQKNRILKDAEKQVLADKEAVLAESKGDIAKMAVLAVEKIIKDKK